MQALKRVIVALLLTALVAGGLTFALIRLYGYLKAPLPLADQCVARVQGESISIDTEQAHYASIIAGVGMRRDLVPRAVTIALATAYQESGIRNLDHGDRDSLGLFQQRPSQGWGTDAQVTDPYYSANAFYAALVKVDGWETGNVNDVAQAVQRSGHPNGYARHVESARRLASSLTGETPASFSCLSRNPSAADPAGLESFLVETLPRDAVVKRTAETVTVRSDSNQGAWSAAHIAVANAGRFGIARVDVAGQSWTASATSMPTWLGTKDNGRLVEITFDARPTPTPGGR